MKKYMCLICGFIYDEAAGMPEEDIPPGTRWEDLPMNWSCPDCGAIMVRNGSCYKCMSCGSTSGCS